jgi:hypothetical protein
MASIIPGGRMFVGTVLSNLRLALSNRDASELLGAAKPAMRAQRPITKERCPPVHEDLDRMVIVLLTRS